MEEYYKIWKLKNPNYYKEYYQRNKQYLDNYHYEWVKENKTSHRNFQKKYQHEYYIKKKLKEQNDKIEAFKLSLNNINEYSDKHESIQ